MKFATFPDIEGWPSTEGGFWGYACACHVDLRDFADRCREAYGLSGKHCEPNHCQRDSFPGHAFVRWTGFGGWTFCFPDDRGAKPITFWNADGCSYDQWLMQFLTDMCHREHREGDDERALRIIRLLQLFRHSGYGPSIDRLLAG